MLVAVVALIVKVGAEAGTKGKEGEGSGEGE